MRLFVTYSISTQNQNFSGEISITHKGNLDPQIVLLVGDILQKARQFLSDRDAAVEAPIKSIGVQTTYTSTFENVDISKLTALNGAGFVAGIRYPEDEPERCLQMLGEVRNNLERLIAEAPAPTALRM